MEKESSSKAVDDESKPVRPRRERRDDNSTAGEKEVVDNNKGGGDDIGDQGPGTKNRRKRDAENNNSGGGGGWMSTNADKKSPIKKHELEEDEPALSVNNKEKHFQDNDEIVIIPDLEEDGGDSDSRVAHAPRNVHRKIPTLTDLENEVKSAIPTIEGGFDLSVLISTLVPPTQIQEKDETWTYDSLLRDITDELTAPTITKAVTESITKIEAPISPITKKITTANNTKSGTNKK